MHIPTTTRPVLDSAHRHGRLLNSGVDGERMVAVTLPRVTIAERRLDEVDKPVRPTWRGRPKQIDARPDIQRFASPRTTLKPPQPLHSPRLASLAGEATGHLAPIAWTAFAVPDSWRVRRGKGHEIIAMVARKADLSVEELCSHRRHARLREPRLVAMALLMRFTDFSLAQIGRLMRRDHSTIIHGRNCIARDVGSLVRFPDEPDACADALFAALKGARK